jgi:hypothetical protein
MSCVCVLGGGVLLGRTPRPTFGALASEAAQQPKPGGILGVGSTAYGCNASGDPYGKGGSVDSLVGSFDPPFSVRP